jgi:hypothetical protein
MSKGTRKEKRKRSGLVRFLLYVGGIAFVAVVGQMTTGIMTQAYRFVVEIFWRPRLEVTLNKCFIYRKGYSSFPSCELDIVAYNPSSRTKMTAELESLRLFREDIVYHFPRGQQVIRVEPKDIATKQITTSDKVFESALKIPQDSMSCTIGLRYKNLTTNSEETISLTDKDVIKCTYWQMPIFNSESEALKLGTTRLDISAEVFFSNRLTGKHGKIQPTIETFTNDAGLSDFNQKELVRHIFKKKDFALAIYLPALRRKYGGFYYGFLASDTVSSRSDVFPYDILGGLGDLEEYNLLGTTLGQDFGNVTEFIHYFFDPAKRNESFGLFYENCRYFVLLVYEEPQGIRSFASLLRNKGYRVGAISTNRFGAFEDILSKIVPVEKTGGLEEKLNAYKDSLNNTIRNNGFFTFFPAPLDPKTRIRINNDIGGIISKSNSLAISFDCRPFQTIFEEAPFSVPVLVFLNFTRETRGVTIDSIKFRYP